MNNFRVVASLSQDFPMQNDLCLTEVHKDFSLITACFTKISARTVLFIYSFIFSSQSLNPLKHAFFLGFNDFWGH